MSEPITVAVLGTGIMGGGMARNLAQAGLPVGVWNRTQEKAEPLAEVGAGVHASAIDAVKGADVVLTMLWDADSVERTMRDAAGGLAPEAIWLQTSTVG